MNNIKLNALALINSSLINDECIVEFTQIDQYIIKNLKKSSKNIDDLPKDLLLKLNNCFIKNQGILAPMRFFLELECLFLTKQKGNLFFDIFESKKDVMCRIGISTLLRNYNLNATETTYPFFIVNLKNSYSLYSINETDELEEFLQKNISL